LRVLLAGVMGVICTDGTSATISFLKAAVVRTAGRLAADAHDEESEAKGQQD
jgi:hypothetical protein